MKEFEFVFLQVQIDENGGVVKEIKARIVKCNTEYAAQIPIGAQIYYTSSSTINGNVCMAHQAFVEIKKRKMEEKGTEIHL